MKQMIELSYFGRNLDQNECKFDLKKGYMLATTQNSKDFMIVYFN